MQSAVGRHVEAQAGDLHRVAHFVTIPGSVPSARSAVILSAFALAALACAGSIHAQARWDLPSGYGANTFQVQNLQLFADGVDKASAGKLKITVHPNASLFKANEIKRAVQSQQVQAREFILSGAANESPVFGTDSIPFLATSYADSRRLDEASRPLLAKTLGAQGVKLLYTVPWPPQSLYSVKPVAALKDLRATKMRAYNPATSQIASALGAQPVTIQLAELPAALATGGVDNFLTSSASGIDSKLCESVKYFYAVAAWLPRNAVVVNQKAFDALDKPTQDPVLREAAAAERRGWAISEQKDGEYLKELAAKGMKIDPSADGLKRELKGLGEQMTADWIKQAGTDGKAVIDAFPARTQGKGNQRMEPRIENGVKVFELTAAAMKWETEPGKFVDAFAYNGQVPGPQLWMTEGDRVRIVVKTELE